MGDKVRASDARRQQLPLDVFFEGPSVSQTSNSDTLRFKHTSPVHDDKVGGRELRSTRLRPHPAASPSIMPTPESESFKAAKPTVPPTFDGVDYDDNKALKAAQDAIIREQWVQSMMARLIREEMGKCYRREGVNHLEKCGDLRGKFGHSTN